MTEHHDDPEELDELEPEVVEDLEVDEDGEDVRGGTAGCITMTF